MNRPISSPFTSATRGDPTRHVLITGATGFVGRALAARLLRDGKGYR